MANKRMKTLQLPGLADTYTFVQADSTLTQAGEAADAKATGEAISANSVSQAYRRTVNLFNKATAVVGYYIDTHGNLAENGNYETSDFIAVEAGATYAGNFTNHAVWYDVQKGFISRTNLQLIVTAPANAHFLRIDYMTTMIGRDAIMLVQGDALPTYYVPHLEPHYIGIESAWRGETWPAYYRPVNLFDAATAISGYYIDEHGNLAENRDFETSDFIAVEAGATYAGNFTNHAVWYNAQKGFISRTNLETIVTAPADAHFLRIDYKTTMIGRDAIMLVQGNALPTYYVPYIDPRYIGLESAWRGKTWAAYGDSITAIANGNTLSTGWAKPVNDTLLFSGFYGRGIGSQSFNWRVSGGEACFINADGTYNSRDNNHTKDDYTGEVPAGTTLCRGAFCSWDRITHMFPASIKDTIDLIFIMGGTNDTLTEDELSWIANDTTDPEWAASSYYADYGGDFDISTLRGGVASTIMKFQAWMPNALIVLGTPMNGQTRRTGQRFPGYTPDEYAKSKIIKDVAAELGIPCIDVYAECGVNVLNSPLYITDGTHPYNEAGKNMLARVIASGLAQNRPRY